MINRLFIPPTQSYFIFGPRGTGKSTWLKQHYRNAFWIDLLDPESFRLFSAAPERLKQILTEQPQHKVVVIDEIQKAPELLNVVHSLIELKQGHQFILTGSSARKLRQQGVNLLGGRALLRYMPPFFAAELGPSFDLPKHLALGMLPIVLDAPNPKEILKAYAGIYLKEEVQSEGIVRNVGDFARFMEAMSFSHASLINTSNIARECQIARKTVDGYLLILEDLLLSFQLQVFRRRAKRAVTHHPKFYFFDTGVYNSLRPKEYAERQNEHDGIALEGLVAQHLKSWIDAKYGDYSLHFWRTSSSVEVDFVIHGPDAFVALEVKNGGQVHPSDLRGLYSFHEEYPEAQLVLLYRGKHIYKEKNITCYPVEQFLLQINPNAPFPAF
jgi:predicted AAA+ superfamily ATPase